VIIKSSRQGKIQLRWPPDVERSAPTGALE